MGDEEMENSPTTESFPTTNGGASSSNDDVKWVCEDVDEDVYAV